MIRKNDRGNKLKEGEHVGGVRIISEHRRIPHHIKKKIVSLPRHKHHPFTYEVHRKHKISHGTLLYMKEYGPKSHIVSVIVKSSVKVLIPASIMSSVGGIGLQYLQNSIVTIIPLLVLLPALNDMIGDFGIIMSSKFTTMLYTGDVNLRNYHKSKILNSLFLVILTVSAISAVYIGILANLVAYLMGVQFSIDLMLKVVLIAIVSSMILITIITLVSLVLGARIFKKGEDPNNFLIPLTTSIADFGSMIIYSLLVVVLFGA